MIETLRLRLLDRDHPARIHLIGVAGSGMSGLALILMEMGHAVSGCDRVTSDETERLQREGLTFSSPHSAESVADAEIVIFSSAIKDANPALAAARAAGRLCLRRAECLAAVLNGKKGLIVAGTHGKTTTSAMTAHLLREGRKRPCHYVGAEIPVLGANAHWNQESDYLVAEGDESDGTLIHYLPEHSIILNIEAEHLDFYRDLDHIKEVFHRLCQQTRGKIFYCSADAGAKSVCECYDNSVSYGWSDADFCASEVSEIRGRTLFTINAFGKPLGRVELGIPGRHNVLNALAAIASAWELGVDFDSIARGLASFAGARRRFETKYLSSNYRIVDDYGHHPTEISATLQTAHSLNPKRLIVLFQPHRFTRTQLLANDFGKALQAADQVYVADVYPASEAPIPGISGQTIVDAIHANGPTYAESVPHLASAHHRLGNILEEGDLFITLGAGNVHEAGTKIARDLAILEEMKRTAPIGELSANLYEPMKKRTTMGVGGCAQFWLEPSSFVAMQAIVNYCRDRNIPIRMIGRGSNVIARDGGIRGAIIHPMGGEFDAIHLEGGAIQAGSNVKLKKLANFAWKHSIAGFEWMDGIPGNVGGSLRMNAGAMGADIGTNLKNATCLNESGDIVKYSRDILVTEYRCIPTFLQNFVLQASFSGTPGDKDEIFQKMEEGKAKRKQHQPVEPSAGCIFINPAEIPAGKLIEEMGLKGSSCGGAKISKTHGNFIINTGNARAVDITDLIDIVRKRALESKGIELRSEAQIIGDREAQF